MDDLHAENEDEVEDEDFVPKDEDDEDEVEDKDFIPQDKDKDFMPKDKDEDELEEGVGIISSNTGRDQGTAHHSNKSVPWTKLVVKMSKVHDHDSCHDDKQWAKSASWWPKLI
jgi:hypothetical protein